MARQSMKNAVLTVIIGLLFSHGWGQHALTDAVVADFEKNKNASDALQKMYKVIEQENNESYAHYTLGFFLKENYKLTPELEPSQQFRENALLAFNEALKLNFSHDQLLIENINKAQKYIISTLYNDALLKAKQFQQGNENSADAAYDYFESWNNKSITPQSSRALRIEFEKRKSERFYEFWEADVKQVDWLTRCIQLYEKILKEDPTDCEAMNNIAIIYYNIGVFKIKQIDADVEFDALMKIQDDALALFHQALPYAQATFNDCPKSATQYKALMFIYRAIGNDEQFNQLQKEFKTNFPQE